MMETWGHGFANTRKSQCVIVLALELMNGGDVGKRKVAVSSSLCT